MKSVLTIFTAGVFACAIAQEPAAPAPAPETPAPAPEQPKADSTAPAPLSAQQMHYVDPRQIEAIARSLFSGEKLPVRTGPVTYLGVAAVEVPQEVAAQLPIPQDTGLLVAGVAPDSPAAKAGLSENDVLTKLGDQIIITPRQLAVLIANHKKDDAVKITYLRKGQQAELTAVLGERIAPPLPADAAGPLARMNRLTIRIGPDGKILEQPQEEQLKALPDEVRKHIEEVIKRHESPKPAPAETADAAKPNP
jgi:membrane-associated protease RseP (regulator of RpoE activity)